MSPEWDCHGQAVYCCVHILGSGSNHCLGGQDEGDVSADVGREKRGVHCRCSRPDMQQAVAFVHLGEALLENCDPNGGMFGRVQCEKSILAMPPTVQHAESV